MTTNRIEDIKKRLGNATKGEWVYDKNVVFTTAVSIQKTLSLRTVISTKGKEGL